jgi:Fe-S cluster biogenesis protein NfuA
MALLLAAEDADTSMTKIPGPVLNGKRVLPYKVLAAGLKQHTISAVYVVLNSTFKRGSTGWEATEFVGVTKDLDATLKLHKQTHRGKVAHVRALSFSFHEPSAMQDVASEWRELAVNAGAKINDRIWQADIMGYLYEDDEDEEEEWNMETVANVGVAVAIVPPDGENLEKSMRNDVDTDGSSAPAFTIDGVDKVLDEVRPYLISDGGNVSVESVDADSQTVYLKLEGACGSCSSSTVTMQMGIERVLKEKYPNLREVLQVEDDRESKPTALDFAAVQAEIGRLAPAISAMGGLVELMSVDPELGVVQVTFRGSNKVQKGLELALLDVPFVKHIKFTMGEK